MSLDQSDCWFVFAQLLLVARLPVRLSRQSAFRAKLYRGLFSAALNLYEYFPCRILCADLIRRFLARMRVRLRLPRDCLAR